MSNCRLCIERGKTWEGSDPKCAFTNGVFTSENWNCATLNKIREKHYCTFYEEWNDDHWVITLPLNMPVEDGEDTVQNFAILYGYKMRGNVEQAFTLGDKIRPLTLKEAESLI